MTCRGWCWLALLVMCAVFMFGMVELMLRHPWLAIGAILVCAGALIFAQDEYTP